MHSKAIKRLLPRLMGVAAVYLICFFLTAVADAQQTDLAELLAMWRAENYHEVVPRLVEYRRSPYGKNVQVDYMLATSCCRIDELVDVGRRYFNRILSSYELSNNDLEQIRRESERCAVTHKPQLMAFLNGRAAFGSDVGVKGKTFYWLDRQNAPIGTELIQVVRDIPIQEFRVRLFPPGKQQEAIAKIRSVAGTGFSIETTEHFVIATSSGQTHSEIQAIGRHLEKVMAFFNSEYGILTPKYMVTVYIAPDQWNFKKMAERVHGLRLADGSIGYSNRDDLSICAVSTGPHAGTLKHELFHLMVRNDFGDIPPWLDEGLASLYEVSRLEGSRVRGLRNWREDVLKRFWKRRPHIGAMLGMPWHVFNAKDYELIQQAVNHATARYFTLYLQEKEKLDAVYIAFQRQTIDDMTGSPGDEAKKLVKTALQAPIDRIDDDFGSWFHSLGQKATSSDITTFQRRLNELGYKAGREDGILGSKTKGALKAFQADHGLTPTGRLDDATLDTLQSPTGKQ